MLRKLLPSCLALLFGLGTAAAQETQSPKTPEPARAARREGIRGSQLRQKHERRRGMAIGRRLNLTEDQKLRAQAIRQKYFAATRTQREQLFQLREKRFAGTFNDQDRELARALRREMNTAMRGLREEQLTVLTAEQRAQLENAREQRKQRREEMKLRREERRKARQPLD